MYYTKYTSKIAPIVLAGDENGLAYLHFDIEAAKKGFIIKDEWEYNDDFFIDIIKELDEYFHGTRKSFTFRLNPKGTSYQKRVWGKLKEIPYGQTCTYKDIASKLGNEKSSRAVGNANSKNPIPVVVPCHRVVGANGKLTGFAYGLDVKKILLNLEKTSVNK